MESLANKVKGKKVLFITTKNIDYIRNTQELRLMERHAAWVDVVYSEANSYFSTVIDILKKLSSKRLKEADIIFAGFSPQLIVPMLKFKRNKSPVIIDFFISVYDTYVCDRKVFKKGGLLAWICHRMDEKALRYAEHVITDTKTHGEWFAEEFGADLSLFENLYLEADPEIYYPRPQEKTGDRKGRFVVLYFGSILPLQGVDIILDMIRLFREDKEILFDIIGPIPEMMMKPEQDNAVYTEWISQEELAGRIAQADLCLAGHFCADIDKASRTIPGKAYIYEAMNRRMVLGDNRANRELFTEDNRHCFVKMGDPKALADIIRSEKENLNFS